MTPAQVAVVSHKWGTYGGVTEALGDTDIAKAEGLIHELAHAAVFGMSLSKDLVRKVDERFGGYVRPRAADVSECAALAVERNVFDVLGWPVQWDVIVKLACEDMRTLNMKVVRIEIERELQRKLNAERAGQVIAWLWELTGNKPPQEWGT